MASASTDVNAQQQDSPTIDWVGFTNPALHPNVNALQDEGAPQRSSDWIALQQRHVAHVLLDCHRGEQAQQERHRIEALFAQG